MIVCISLQSLLIHELNRFLMAEKTSPFKKFVAIAGVLIILQICFIFYFSGQTGPGGDPQEVLHQALKNATEPVDRQVAVAIMMYKAEHEGKLPQALDELVPKYLPVRPVDPSTKKPYAYKAQGDSYVLGEAAPDGTVIAKGAKGDVLGGEKLATDEAAMKNFLKALSESPNTRLAHYDPKGKRDPFRPFDLSGKGDFEAARTPLETIEINDLLLTAVVEQGGDARAVVETPDGKGHTVKKGDKIGTHGGEVVEILGDRVQVLEQIKDFTGETKSHTVEIYMKGASPEKPGTKKQNTKMGGRRS